MEEYPINNLFQKEFSQKTMTAAEAVRMVRSGDTVYIGTFSSVAYKLLEALGDREEELEDVTLTCSQIVNPVRILSGKNPRAFRSVSYFMGVQERNMQKHGLNDFTCVHLSQVDIFCRETAPADVLFLEVSEPDKHGYMSYGSAGVALHGYLLRNARKIILQVNRNVPYVFGEQNLIHVTQADAIVFADNDLSVNVNRPADAAVTKISEYLVDQIRDGACIQIGLGSVANAVGYGLKQRNDLGAHSEMMGDSLMELMKAGNLNNSRKSFMPGKTVASFAFGSRELYEFCDRNPALYFMPFPVVNDTRIIAQNDDMISINTAMSIDIMGQVNADNIGGVQYSGIGGQLDFVRGAQMSKGGKSFIAVTSTYQDKKLGKASRIVSHFPIGTAVTTPRADVQYVVTEHGCVNLKTLTMKQRVHAMISLADPDFRPQLTEDAKAAGLW